MMNEQMGLYIYQEAISIFRCKPCQMMIYSLIKSVSNEKYGFFASIRETATLLFASPHGVELALKDLLNADYIQKIGKFKNSYCYKITDKAINEFKAIQDGLAEVKKVKSKQTNKSKREAHDESFYKDAPEDFEFIYLAKQLNEKNVYKIGKTKNLARRESSFRTGNPFIKIIGYKLVLEIDDVESRLHKLFASKILQGEWFYLDDNDVHNLFNNFEFNTGQ